MLNRQSSVYQLRLVKALALTIGMFALAWKLAGWIVDGNSTDLTLVAIAAIGVAFSIALIKDWRYGVYCFLVWLVFEDLIRKFTGNGVALFFAKDVILGLTYVAMWIAFRERRLLAFKPPFLLSLIIFFCVGVLEVFNTNIPNVIYGLLGLKLYFYYVPLMFAGYALLRSEEDLYKILMLNTWIALVIAGLGVAQSVLGLSFLNPTEQASDLRLLSTDIRTTPLSHLHVERPTSVYVSDGRFAEALILFFVLVIGTCGYLLMRGSRGRKLVFPTVGIVVLATVMGGVRHAFISILASSVIWIAAVLWGSGRRLNELFRVGKAIRLITFFASVAVVFMIFLFPDAIQARWALYTETLTPGTSTSDLGFRAWEYPVANLVSVFTQPNWQFGNGIGTASLGTQYVSRLIGARPRSLPRRAGTGD